MGKTAQISKQQSSRDISWGMGKGAGGAARLQILGGATPCGWDPLAVSRLRQYESYYIIYYYILLLLLLLL
jgi:hypothetical protein